MRHAALNWPGSPARRPTTLPALSDSAPQKYGDHASVVSASIVGTGTGGNPAVWRNSMAPGIGTFYSYSVVGFMQRTIPEQKPFAYEQAWGDFAARHNVLFVSSSGGGTQLPGSMYNGLVVAAGVGKLGTTRDGRVFRHLHYPAGTSSAAAGAVGGGVAVLMQAATRGDGGPGTAAAASDARTLKALILNGATKQPDWHNSPTAPLDESQGAGMINVFNAHAQLAGGRLATLAGWDLRTLSSADANGCNIYEFTLVADPGASDSTPSSITLASTIVWNR